MCAKHNCVIAPRKVVDHCFRQGGKLTVRRKGQTHTLHCHCIHLLLEVDAAGINEGRNGNGHDSTTATCGNGNGDGHTNAQSEPQMVRPNRWKGR